jgi:vacuolar-type H+-ATPase subunit F/Vma7
VTRAVSIGEAARVSGFGLAGVEVLPAEDVETVVRTWSALSEDVSLVILTPMARAALGERLDGWTGALWTVLPS